MNMMAMIILMHKINLITDLRGRTLFGNADLDYINNQKYRQ